ncbi:5'/3'-nucleotidase SurE [Rubinisphaera sp.]|uniref:5'/3'-nucleotidase SurE n=1 Tax=Rubinisphaera sp. TaxID=2024857 RepID=UPI000C104D4C|nr:5'/3'-nucleotidase SurE [Rubinisphaera sp.]MBV12249.1 5'/3'-nucleotidase SurE [Rubinisphaera sp.]
MHILLANDDGIHAPGLIALESKLRALGEVTVVAPAHEQSGVGHSITYRSPLQAEEVFREGKRFGWSVLGSPADCVKLGILELCPRKPDLIVSGINSGSNYGINVLYSGTVAAAIEGAFFGIPSVAISLNTTTPPDYELAASRSVRILQKLLREMESRDPIAGSLWSINFPPSDAKLQGIRFATMGVKRHTETMEKRIDPRGKPYYWSGTDPLHNHEFEAETDIRALSENFVTITPLKFDLTDYDRLPENRSPDWDCL